MPWQDQLRQAAFRGVEFLFEDADTEVGRRIVRHEYPQRDKPFSEDLGRKARQYSLRAFVIGPEYMAARDALLAACEKPGPGQLVHPFLGTLSVVVISCGLSESTSRGGMATFSLVFAESGEDVEPRDTPDTAQAVTDSAAAADAAAIEAFAEGFGVDGQPDYVVADARSSIEGLTASFGAALGDLNQIRIDPVSELQALLPENLTASLSDAAGLASGVVGLVRAVASAGDGLQAQLAGLAQLLAFDLPVISSGSIAAGRVALNANRTATNNLVREASTAAQVKALAFSAPATLSDAALARGQIVDLVDQVLLNEATSQQSAAALQQLRSDAVAHLSAQSATMPRLVSVTARASRPAIVEAHDFYGDSWAEQEADAELILRNNIAHPLAVPAGQGIRFLVPA